MPLRHAISPSGRAGATAAGQAQTRYNAFGEVAAKGLNGGWQEWAEYTTQGKVWKTNTGDGGVKLYLHDTNGNTTREIRAGVGDDGAGSTRDLGTLTLAQASSDTTLLHTVSLYDKRNLLIRTLEPRISRTGSTVTLSQQFTQLATSAMKDTATDAAKNLAGTLVKQSFDAASDTLKRAASMPGAVAKGLASGAANTDKARSEQATVRFMTKLPFFRVEEIAAIGPPAARETRAGVSADRRQV